VSYTYALFVFLHFLFFLFFFSSRRRHTRSKRDWSSDVCSSDLLLKLLLVHSCCLDIHQSLLLQIIVHIGRLPLLEQYIPLDFPRSEERRVGKECSARWSRDQERKKHRQDEVVDRAHAQKREEPR